ncbi:MAG: (2Fe-2S)-binding protein [Clostridium sp.]
MSEQLKEEVMDKLTKVCVCTGTTRKTIKEAVKNGASSFDEVKSKTGAGSGSCNGNRCKSKIEGIINSLNNI